MWSISSEVTIWKIPHFKRLRAISVLLEMCKEERKRTEESSASVVRLPKPVLRGWRFEFYEWRILQENHCAGMILNYSRFCTFKWIPKFQSCEIKSILLYWIIFLPFNESWSRPVPCNALGFISNDAKKIWISFCYSRFILTLTINLSAICSY